MFKSNYTPNQELPKEVKYFKEELICELLPIPVQKPEMERVLDVMVWPEVKRIDIVKTEKGQSNEGQHLGGIKLIVEVLLKEKLLYVADRCEQPVHAVHYDTLKSIFVILPEEIDGRKVCELIKLNKIQVIPYIEKVYFRMLDDRNVHKCVLLLADVKINK